MTEQWKKEMQQKMADYRESDIEVPWADIEKALAANGKQARVVPLWTKRIAAAAVVLLIVGGGYWILNHQQTEIGKQTGQAESQMASVPQQEKSQNSETMQDIQDRIAQKIQQVRTQGLLSLVTTDDTDKETETAAPANEMTPAEESAAEEASVPADTVFFPSYPSTQQHQTVYPSELRKRNAPSNRLTAKVYLSNTMAGSSHYSSSIDYGEDIHKNGDGYQVPQGGNIVGLGGPQGSQGQGYGASEEANTADNLDNNADKSYFGGVDNDLIPSNYAIQTSEHVQHHQPIRFGFSFRYRLDNRWSVESGLNYTRLSADITHTVNGQTTETEQHLNYIGIPLSASYQLWGSRYFNFYLSAGGLVEKMVKGSRTTQGTTNSVSIHPLQVSVNGAVGAEFKFIDRFSLYAEPSLNYYFDNGSTIPTFYQEKPLNFNLNVGIRFDLK
jgi:hypothetical protein